MHPKASSRIRKGVIKVNLEANLDDRLIEIIGKYAAEDAGQITRDSAIADLGVDSFSIVEIIFELEDLLGIEINFNVNDSRLAELKTVGELIDAVRDLAEKERT